jgi:acyl-CoA thioesterase-2
MMFRPSVDIPSDFGTLAELLDLTQTGGDTFRGRSSSSSPPRVFGGQLVAQALAAAGRTVAPERVPHSLHAHFLHPGDPGTPIDYQVDDVRDGRAQAVRRVVAEQDGRSLCTLVASFAQPTHGPAHQVPAALPVELDRVPSAQTSLADADERTRAWFAGVRSALPLDVRFVDSPARDAVLRGERPEPRQRILVRSAAPLPADPLLHACALAYASDLFLLSTALLPHGLLIGTAGVLAVSLDHAVWFHAPLRADEWVQHEMDSEWAGEGRALCRGRMRDGQGRLVASVMQEGLVRCRSRV